ncbi:MAG: WYL domain-containing protein [Candidatus Riflebacteria bacterium]|nr:WYL domain-containing protein [Candidatus Riflebacteria bacterium]
MSKTLALRRFSLIMEKVMVDHFPTFAAIKGFLERNGFECSGRTLQRDLAGMEHLFQIKIAYDHLKRGYFFDREQSINADVFLRFLQLTCTADLLHDTVAEGKKALQHLSFGTAGDPAGSQWLRPLLEAIRSHRLVSFSYKNFFEEEAKAVGPLAPLLLREYLGRWYLVGSFLPHRKLYSFGLDRMTGLVAQEAHFVRPPDVDPAAIFAQVIGVTHADEPPQRVLLAFRQNQGKYVKTLPWHPSQRVLREDGEDCLIELVVIPTHELVQRILMFGDGVTVREPASLAILIRNTLEDALALYR